MGDRGRSKRILCVNCNICVNTFRRYPALTLDSRVISLLCSWVYPIIITEEDCICEACKDLAVNQSLKQEVSGGSNDHQAGPSRRGHTHVCLLCGCSILRRQSNQILRETLTDLQRSIKDTIENRVSPRPITESDRVCQACWLRTQREARRMSITDEARPHHDVTEDTQPLEPVTSDHPVTSDQRSPNIEIELPEYRRAANTSSRCVFPNCSSSTLRVISDKLRAIVLSSHHFYLPKLARVCDEHLEGNMWDTLFSSERSIITFTAEQVQHVFSFVNAFNPTLDFENIDQFDDKVFVYWVGYTKEQFQTLLDEVPRIKEIRHGSLGLAMLLLKMRTGDSNQKISSLINMPRRTLEMLMDKVREVLLQDFVPKNLGIEKLKREELLELNL